jgi:ABC-type Fe3+-hydroxamate transport system substrate-binding protein
MLIGMGAGDRLVAVSNFDSPRDATRNLPRVGDYQTTDWERLASLRPRVMITQFGQNRLPVALTQKSEQLDIKLVNLSITRLSDIEAALVTLGDAIGEKSAGESMKARLRQKLDDIAARSAGPRVRALVVVDEAARGVAGRENYLDDLLQLCGAENVVQPGSPYPMIDREILLDLDPAVIFHLLPGASMQVRAQAQRVWQMTPQLQAVRNGRVHLVSDPWSLNPTQHVAELAETFSRAIVEARSTSRPATRPAPLAKGTP